MAAGAGSIACGGVARASPSWDPVTTREQYARKRLDNGLTDCSPCCPAQRVTLTVTLSYVNREPSLAMARRTYVPGSWNVA